MPVNKITYVQDKPLKVSKRLEPEDSLMPIAFVIAILFFCAGFLIGLGLDITHLVLVMY